MSKCVLLWALALVASCERSQPRAVSPEADRSAAQDAMQAAPDSDAPADPAATPAPSPEQIRAQGATDELHKLELYVASLEDCSAASTAPTFDEASMLALQETSDGQVALRDELEAAITARRRCTK